MGRLLHAGWPRPRSSVPDRSRSRPPPSGPMTAGKANVSDTSPGWFRGFCCIEACNGHHDIATLCKTPQITGRTSLPKVGTDILDLFSVCQIRENSMVFDISVSPSRLPARQQPGRSVALTLCCRIAHLAEQASTAAYIKHPQALQRPHSLRVQPGHEAQPWCRLD